ncbi:MAG TPA: reverse transcriptase domain-containing protein [Polyangiaceae bacterium]|nr:reverse transcriptase domain-containing protein [Polyangiaceae bacterium]
MSDALPPRTRKELYERIARGQRADVTLEEMIRLGFWTEDRPVSTEPQAEARVKELQRRLSELRQEAATLTNLKKLAEAAKQKRMAESRQRRLETKQRHLAERAAKRAAFQERKQRELTYLGSEVSAGLGPVPDRRQTNESALATHDLPVLPDPPALAQALGLSLSELRFLAYSREVSTVTQYRRFEIPKRSGGTRVISAPRKRLKAAQRWILDALLTRPTLCEQAHGFRKGRSIVTNARPHVGAEVVVNVDLRDFFPTVTYPRVKGLFRKLGYSEEVATLLALLCTEADTVETELDGVTYYVAQGRRHLPQGAPTSPALTNLLCRRLDRRLSGFACKHGMVYSRYADDLTLSSALGTTAPVGAMLAVLKKVVEGEGFVLHPDKISVKHRGRRQEVTGIVVNDRLSVDRRTMKRFRAFLYQLEKDGPAGKHWGKGTDPISSAVGFANYLFMVDPERALPLRQRALALRAKHRDANS